MTQSADAISPSTRLAGAGPQPRSLPIPLRDRAWMPFHTVRSVGPVRTPSGTAIRELLIKLRATDPQHPLVCRLDEHRGRLHPVTSDDLDSYLSSVIVDAPADAGAVDLGRQLQSIPLAGLPFRIAVSERAAAMRSAHALGDTATANPWFFGLLKADDPDRALGLITGGRTSRFPLGSALVNQFGRDPRRAVRALRGAMPLGPSKINQSRPARREQALPASAVPELITRTAGPEVEAGLRGWRTEHAPKASMAALWMAASVRALRAHGIDTGAGVFTMMNCRRYLPEGSAVRGNFAVGPYLLPADLSDPSSLGTELATAAVDGVPLVLLSAIAARSVLRRGRPARMPTTVPPGAAPKINLSYFGGITEDDVDWAVTRSGPEARYVVAAEPAGPHAITYVFARSPYGMHLSATAHRQFTDVDALGSALDQVATDPVGLLT